MTGVPVLAAPVFDPGGARIELTLPEGLTVFEIVAQALPGATGADLARTRVSLVTDRGTAIITPARWKSVRPKSGVRVVIRLVPGKDALRTVLQIVVSIAAVALGQFWAAGLGFAVGTAGFALASSAIALGLPVYGALSVNALAPPTRYSD